MYYQTIVLSFLLNGANTVKFRINLLFSYEYTFLSLGWSLNTKYLIYHKKIPNCQFE